MMISSKDRKALEQVIEEHRDSARRLLRDAKKHRSLARFLSRMLREAGTTRQSAPPAPNFVAKLSGETTTVEFPESEAEADAEDGRDCAKCHHADLTHKSAGRCLNPRCTCTRYEAPRA